MREAASIILLVAGGVISLYGFIRYLTVIYRHGIPWLIFCLIALPVGYIAFLILHPKESLIPVAVTAGGIAVQAAGCLLSPGLLDMIT